MTDEFPAGQIVHSTDRTRMGVTVHPPRNEDRPDDAVARVRWMWPEHAQEEAWAVADEITTRPIEAE